MADFYSAVDSERGVDDQQLIAALEKRLHRLDHPTLYFIKRLPRRARNFMLRRLPQPVRSKIEHLQTLALRWWERRTERAANPREDDMERAAEREAMQRRARLVASEQLS